MPSSSIEFYDHGIASILNRYSLVVPVNQRPYAWTPEHVRALYTDLDRAINDGDGSEYFLGTMVGIRQGPKALDVADGQQRLATTTILIAAIRDHLSGDTSHAKYVQHLESNYLRTYDPDTNSDRPKLSLNVEDNEVYIHSVIEPPGSANRRPFPERPSVSHRALQDAVAEAKITIRKITDTPEPADQIRRLKKWVSFLENSAKMILVIVPDAAKAFTIFETLNDRGLKLSQVHLLKNYLYGLAHAGNRMREAQQKWDAMYGALDSIGDDDIFIDYVRQMWISYHGHVKVENLFTEVKRKKKTADDAVEFAGQLADNVTPFIALLNPSHSYWPDSFGVRQCVSILNDSLNVNRIRPLMLSVAMCWKKPHELEMAFSLCVSWAVRFLIVGGIGSGTNEEFYADAACKVRSGTIADPASLAAAMRDKAPTDAQFSEEFSRATVSKSQIARYYLRALEAQKRDDKDALWVEEENPEKFDLEHVIPLKPSSEWRIDEEDCKRLCKRIGNLALIEKRINSVVRSSGPSIKLVAYKKSNKLLTKIMGTQSVWGETQIASRQSDLSKLAVKTWPIKVRT